jgi:putative transcriptional regulator
MKLKDLESIDVEAVAQAIERDAGEPVTDIRAALDDVKRGNYAATHTPEQMAIRAARKQLGISQATFAEMIHTPVATLRDWEQGRYAPSGAAVTLSQIAADHPEILREYA